MDIKPLPCNIQAEQAVLGAILYNPENIVECIGVLKPQDFYDLKHQLIYYAMLKLYSQNITIDLVTLADFLKSKLKDAGGITYITQIVDSYLSIDVKAYVNIVKEYSNKRQIIKIARDMEQQGFSEDKNAKEILNAVEDKIFSITESKAKEMVTAKDAMLSTLNIIEENYKKGGGITGLPTGFYDIDNSINGLNKGDFIIIAARPSMGKTALALNIAANVSKKNNVALFSLEMPKEQLLQRILASETMIRFDNLIKGKLNDADMDKVTKVSSMIANRKLMIDDNAGITIGEIKAKCKKLKIKQGLEVVVIDYLGLIESGEKSESRQVEISKISRHLKTMAKELGVTIITLCQLNRAPEARRDNRPQLSDLRESGSIEQDADIVMLLYRDDYYNPDSKDKGIAEVIIGKNRNGEVGVKKLGWLGEFQKFQNLEWRDFTPVDEKSPWD